MVELEFPALLVGVQSSLPDDYNDSTVMSGMHSIFGGGAQISASSVLASSTNSQVPTTSAGLDPAATVTHEKVGFDTSDLSDVDEEHKEHTMHSPTLKPSTLISRADSVIEEHLDVAKSPSFSTSDFSDNEHGNEDDELDAEFQKYDLRESARQKLPLTAWIDKDESGNYDPVEERKKAYAQQRQAQGPTQRRRRAREASNSRERRHATYKSLESGRLNGAQLHFSISLGRSFTGENLSKVTSLVAAIPDHWPEDSWNYLDEDYFGKQDVTGDRVDGNGLPHDGRRRAMQYGYDENGDYITLADPFGEHDTLEGHSCARGCVQCRRGGFECSLLSNKYGWPCEACIEDDEECQLIVPPVRKASCRGCTISKIKCSFRDQLIQPPKCNQCASKPGTECIAGPAPGYEAPPNRYGDAGLGPPPRPFAGCTSCREQSMRCSLKKTDNPPCKSCSENGIACIFEAVFKQGKKGKAKLAAQPESADADEDVVMIDNDTDYDSEVLETLDPTPLPTDIDNNALVELKAPCFDATIDRSLPTFWITTMLCHPITFDSDTTNNQFSNAFGLCSFCRDPIFAIVGHDNFVRVKVQETNGGLCWEEKSKHGHYARNKPPTRVCTEHTMERYQIVQCQHEIEPLDEKVAALYLQLFQGPDAEPHPERMCSLCPTPASARCTVLRFYDPFGGELKLPAKGCGLQLCAWCIEKLQQRFGGDLDRLVKDMVANDSQYPLGVRADAELLERNGLLMRNVNMDLMGNMDGD